MKTLNFTNSSTDNILLSESERARFEENEAAIHNGLLSFVDMGFALIDIRESRLYREHYDTFEAYCRNRWGFTRQRAFQLIGGAEKAEYLSTAVDIEPTSEAQVRPLVGLSDELAVQAWKLAEKKAKECEITGRLVKEAANEVRGVGLKVSTNESDRDLSTLDRLCGKLSAKEDWDDNAKNRFKMNLKKLMGIGRDIGILDDA